MTKRQHIDSTFHNKVVSKYNVYNGLFLDLPYSRDEKIGVVIPLLLAHVEKGLENRAHPVAIMEDFFSSHYQFRDEKNRIGFMFKVIQFIERQVVLFDSVEDAVFKELATHQNTLQIGDFRQVAKKESREEDFYKKLSNFSARLVLTAHPTQFYPPSVLNIISDLRRSIGENDIVDINRLLRQLGLTSLVNRDKPTPLEEAKNIIYHLRHIYYQSIADIFQEVKNEFSDRPYENYNILKLGFWPGGDRDGNPFVTHETTLEVADELRLTLMKCYYNDIKTLQRKLTFKKTQEPIRELRVLLYDAMFNKEKQVTTESVLEPLRLIEGLLHDEYHGIYVEEIHRMIDKVKIFGTHFAAIDLRQDHSVHKLTMTEILKQNGLIKENLDELKSDQLMNILVNEEINLQNLIVDDPLVAETINTFSIIPHIQEKNGTAGCERYIISNSEDIYSVLFVFALLRWSLGNLDNVHMDIVPLFETMKGMNESGMVMKDLFQLESYKEHLEKRGNTQTMMLGFSDGTKDGGYLKANWSIHTTKEQLTQECNKHGIRPVFFDGRGGPPARGGGKTHRFYAAQGNAIANHEFQLTIQGQTITSMYGTPEQFKFNSQQLITAALSNEFFSEQANINKDQRDLIEELSSLSFEKYESLKNHPKFIDYLEQKSTLKYYGMAKIGSRPGKRGKDKKLTLKDLRAISFVGSWNQLKQNVPGYFGIGTAIQQVKDSGRMDQLKLLFKEAKWFRALMLNAMMALCKSNFNLTAYMKEDKEFGEFWNLLHDEFKLSEQMLLEISGYEVLMQEEAISKESISMREQMVLPLLVIQQFALFKISENDSQKEVYEKMVTRSLFGNINASRNSA